MKTLEYIIVKDIIKIKLVYELKDLYKSNFKTSRWNSKEKVWEINHNTRNINKLDKWIKEVKESGIMETIKNKSGL